MVRNIIIGILSLLVIFLIVFSQIKISEVEKAWYTAEVNMELALENEAKAKAQEQKAVEMAAAALIAQGKAEEAEKRLLECKTGK